MEAGSHHRIQRNTTLVFHHVPLHGQPSMSWMSLSSFDGCAGIFRQLCLVPGPRADNLPCYLQFSPNLHVHSEIVRWLLSAQPFRYIQYISKLLTQKSLFLPLEVVVGLGGGDGGQRPLIPFQQRLLF